MKKIIILILIIIAKNITTNLIFFYTCTLFKRKQFKSRYNKYMTSLSIPEFFLLKFIRDFASLKQIGSLFQRMVPLNSLTHKFLFCTCLVQVVPYFLSYMRFFLLNPFMHVWPFYNIMHESVKIITCEKRAHIAEAFLYFNHQFGNFVYGFSFSHLNLIITYMIVFVYHIQT